MLEVVMAAALVTMLVVTIGAVVAGRTGRGRANLEHGSLYVTGVSPLPAMTGEHYVTITGTVTGPSITGKVVYRRFAWDAAHWPAPGDHLAIAYPPHNPDDWHAEHPGLRPYLGS
ncbi:MULTISPECIES: hypothetical protein [Nocardia]|uniref:hypothetical protein n=1 Tax=Nocardia TaxID=1817 RepID=UPI0006F71CB1|nr:MULTISPECIES: hypothetical protein [Nocardia]KQY38356.1 hypothetical protein ASD42_07970 [Nocardia sp. Root136]